jgi:hypothetical protein
VAVVSVRSTLATLTSLSDIGILHDINKAQGQTFDSIGLLLQRPVFAHGQLYVALSRVKSMNGIRVALPVHDDDNGNDQSTTKNIVYRSILQDVL